MCYFVKKHSSSKELNSKTEKRDTRNKQTGQPSHLERRQLLKKGRRRIVQGTREQKTGRVTRRCGW